MASILIVEDESRLRSNLERFLRGEGYSVETAVTGEEALQKLHTQAPQLLLLDQNLPGLTGVEVLGHARQGLPDVPVILMSGQLDSRLRESARYLCAALHGRAAAA